MILQTTKRKLVCGANKSQGIMIWSVILKYITTTATTTTTTVVSCSGKTANANQWRQRQQRNCSERQHGGIPERS